MEKMMQDTTKNLELVSALADGQLRGEEFARTVEWVGSADEARQTWHAYHLMGDILRTGEVMASGRDAAFVQRLKLCLQQEVPLAPNVAAINLIAGDATSMGAGGIKQSARRGSNDSGFRWKLLAGVASLAAVSVIGWHGLSGWNDPRGAAPQLAQLPAQIDKPEIALSQAIPGDELHVMIRDPQLDALLAAHREFGGTSALQMPAGFLRNATFEGAAR